MAELKNSTGNKTSQLNDKDPFLIGVGIKVPQFQGRKNATLTITYSKNLLQYLDVADKSKFIPLNSSTTTGDTVVKKYSAGELTFGGDVSVDVVGLPVNFDDFQDSTTQHFLVTLSDDSGETLSNGSIPLEFVHK